ncbi:probable plastid-lipid-associated protein 10 chloroplastic [Phtheirospermum japonicum]|uniref:Probable plastid-lipid-associated protein 10 chloroplastic n=1 Tax=Phtheirospermum japonicum TaxID=374723 RepID=A0A830CTF4_9LAMI|nr:probable plastid-lipid-associated protein 10 chloroplastic [Phtheirospermum japonicum]
MDAASLKFFPTPQKRRFHSPICLASSAPVGTRVELNIEVESRKFELLSAVTDTQRGLNATPHQRSTIEETLVSVECLDAGKPINLGLLDGTWRLQYTSAPDVLILFQSATTLPLLEVGQVFQKFECGEQSGEGVVRNVVRWSIPGLLEEHEGATLLVSAKFSVVSARNIYLEFEEIAIQNINISEDLQAILAPAILPSSLDLSKRKFLRSVGGLYYLSYLDSNMLLGRAVGGGGVFVFTRTQAFN